MDLSSFFVYPDEVDTCHEILLLGTPFLLSCSPTSPRHRGLPHIERLAEPRTTNRPQINPATVRCFPKIIVQGISACKRTILFVDHTKIGIFPSLHLDAILG